MLRGETSGFYFLLDRFSYPAILSVPKRKKQMKNYVNAYLTPADLTDANLTDANLYCAKYSEATAFPDNFDPVKVGMIKI